MYQPFDTLNCMEEISASALSIAIVATIIYLWLRSVAHRRGTPALQRAQSHSFWCALIAFFSSTSWDLSQIWSTPTHLQSTLALVLVALGGPGWLALVYIIGLFTWPKELHAVRVASLEPRSLTTPFPRKLGAFVGALAIVALCMLWPVSRVTAYVSETDREASLSEDYADFSDAGWDGLSRWRSGSEVAPLFALCIFGVLVATAAIAFIILKRRPLARISTEHNHQLRTVWLNRLLRNCGWLLISIITAAISYANPVLGHGWNTPSTFVPLGLGLVLFVWAPKFATPSVGANGSTGPFSRMRDHTLAVSIVSNTALIVAAYIIGIAASNRFDQALLSFGPAKAKFESNLLVLSWGTAAVVFSLAISAGFALYAHLRAKQGTPNDSINRSLPLWVYVVAAMLIISGSMMLYFPETLSPRVNPMISPWIPTAIIAGMLLSAAGYFWWIRRCAVPWDVSDEQEIWYRQILEFRALRVLGSAFFLLPGVALSDEPAMVAIGIGLFCVPSLLVVKRPKVHSSKNVPA